MNKYTRKAPNHAAGNPDPLAVLTRPAALAETIQVLPNSGETLVTGAPAQTPITTVPSVTEVDRFCTSFKRVMYTTDGISADLIDTASLGMELLASRINAPATLTMPVAPDYADTLLLPAFDSIIKSLDLLNHEDPALMRDDDLAQLQLARQLVTGYQGILDVIDPLQFGAMARRVQALAILAAFCQHIAKDGASAIARNRILTKALQSLTAYMAARAAAAAATKQLKAETSHEVEASTLARVTAANAAGGTTAASGAAGSAGTAATGGQVGTPPPPPGGVVVPEPVHPRPKRHAPANPSAPKTKSKTPTSKK